MQGETLKLIYIHFNTRHLIALVPSCDKISPGVLFRDADSVSRSR